MNKKTILAIDVGTGMVKVLAGRMQPDGSLGILGTGAAPTVGYDKGIISDINALTHSIRQAVDCVIMAADSQTTDNVYLGLSGASLAMQNSIGSIALANQETVTPQDIERAYTAASFAVIDNNYEKLHVFPVKESVIAEGTAFEVDVHMISAQKTILEGLTQLLAANGLTLKGIVAGGIVAAETIKKELTGHPSNFIFMDIGAGTADCVLYADGKLCSSASLPFGGDYITNDLMQGLSVNRSHAEEIKRYYSRLSPDLRNQGVVLDCNDYGTTDKHVSYDFLYDIIESRTEEIAALVHEAVKPLVDEHIAVNGLLEAVYLTGGAGTMPSMVTCIAKAFQAHTEIVKPMQLADEYASPLNTAGYGIISYGVQNLASEPVAGGKSAWGGFIHKAKKLLKI
ncbi:MAG: ftsA 2 [Firmicutes bacterium]|nr:ftsA 2 [Bacillota bacterium]